MTLTLHFENVTRVRAQCAYSAVRRGEVSLDGSIGSPTRIIIRKIKLKLWNRMRCKSLSGFEWNWTTPNPTSRQFHHDILRVNGGVCVDSIWILISVRNYELNAIVCVARCHPKWRRRTKNEEERKKTNLKCDLHISTMTFPLCVDVVDARACVNVYFTDVQCACLAIRYYNMYRHRLCVWLIHRFFIFFCLFDSSPAAVATRWIRSSNANKIVFSIEKSHWQPNYCVIASRRSVS